MVAAPSLCLQRLPVFYCYLGKITLATVGLLWWHEVWQTTECQAWSEAFGSDTAPTISYYDILN